MGFQRNLAAAEIVDQVRAAAALLAKEDLRISNVVYMGMGEPLLNLGPVLDSVRILTHPRGQALSHRSLSISTVGIPSGILRLARAEPQVNLALSLHAPDDGTRALLVPDKHRHTVAEVLEAAWRHFDLTHRKLLVEYVLLDRTNDSTDQARKLAALLRGHVATVNLMTWNDTSVEDRRSPSEPTHSVGVGDPPPSGISAFKPARPSTISAFRSILREAKIESVVRQSRGANIGAACGQLAGRHVTRRSGLGAIASRPSAGENPE
jgi:23S rRNA (adenine2503-C2)-methyltransferase